MQAPIVDPEGPHKRAQIAAIKQFLAMLEETLEKVDWNHDGLIIQRGCPPGSLF